MNYRVFCMTAALVLAGCSREVEDQEVESAPVDRPPHLIAEHKPSLAESVRKDDTPEQGETSAADEDSELAGLSPEARKRYQDLSDALDENDAEKVLALTLTIGPHSDHALREKAIEALAWFGDNLKALEKLQSFIDDKDEDLAADALRRTDDNVDLIEDEKQRNGFLLKTFLLHREDSGTIDLVCEKLKTYEMTPGLMETLINAERMGSVLGGRRARDAYKFITGENFTTPERAREWVKENAE